MKALVGGSWEVLVWRSCKIRSSSSRPSYDDLVRFFQRSWQEDLAQGPLQFLVRRFCGDPSEMLSEAFAWSCTGPCEKLLTRSWWHLLGCPYMIWYWSLWEALVEILLRGPCIKILKILCVGAYMKASLGMLIGTSCVKILWVPLCGSIYKVLLLQLLNV